MTSADDTHDHLEPTAGITLERVLADADIRPALRTRVRSTRGHDSNTAIIEELGICRGRVRVDLAVVNGSIHGYEIKSDRDSLRRLVGQAEIYSRVLDRVTLVVGERHVSEALEIVPNWWGVLYIDPMSGCPGFKTMRRERKNPSLDPRSLVEFLWLDDAIALLDRHNAARGVRGKPRHVVWDRVCEVIEVHEIAAAVRTHLKARAASSASVPLQ